MEAEDVLVMAFTKILERIDQYKGNGSFEGWIKRIVINEALGALRSNRSAFLIAETDINEIEIESVQHCQHLEVEDLLKMVSQLPAGYRSVFNLFAIDGYSHKEIAEQLGISENTSKSQLNRARNLLQKFIKSESTSHPRQHDIAT